MPKYLIDGSLAINFTVEAEDEDMAYAKAQDYLEGLVNESSDISEHEFHYPEIENVIEDVNEDA